MLTMRMPTRSSNRGRYEMAHFSAAILARRASLAGSAGSPFGRARKERWPTALSAAPREAAGSAVWRGQHLKGERCSKPADAARTTRHAPRAHVHEQARMHAPPHEASTERCEPQLRVTRVIPPRHQPRVRVVSSQRAVPTGGQPAAHRPSALALLLAPGHRLCAGACWRQPAWTSCCRQYAP